MGCDDHNRDILLKAAEFADDIRSFALQCIPVNNGDVRRTVLNQHTDAHVFGLHNPKSRARFQFAGNCIRQPLRADYENHVLCFHIVKASVQN